MPGVAMCFCGSNHSFHALVQAAMTSDHSVLLLSGDQLQTTRFLEAQQLLTSVYMPGIDSDGVSLRAFSNDGIMALSFSSCKVLLWDSKTHMGLHTLQLHTSAISCCSFSATGELLAVADIKGLVSVWEVEWGTLLQLARCGPAPAACCRCTGTPASSASLKG